MRCTWSNGIQSVSSTTHTAAKDWSVYVGFSDKDVDKMLCIELSTLYYMKFTYYIYFYSDCQQWIRLQIERLFKWHNGKFCVCVLVCSVAVSGFHNAPRLRSKDGFWNGPFASELKDEVSTLGASLATVHHSQSMASLPPYHCPFQIHKPLLERRSPDNPTRMPLIAFYRIRVHWIMTVRWTEICARRHVAIIEDPVWIMEVS